MEQDNLLIDPKLFDEIERYVLGQMNEKDRLQFEERLDNEKWLKDEVYLQSSLMAAIEAKTFSEEQQQKDKLKSESSRPLMQRWLVAASVAVLIVAGAIWLITRPSNAEQLYSKYYSADPGLATTMGISDNYEFERGMVDYKQKEYKGANARWIALKPNHVSNDTLSYFIGMAYLNDDDHPAASRELELVRANKSSAFFESATWYLALSHLKEGRKEIAIKLLNEIPSFENSKDLLAELKP